MAGMPPRFVAIVFVLTVVLIGLVVVGVDLISLISGPTGEMTL